MILIYQSSLPAAEDNPPRIVRVSQTSRPRRSALELGVLECYVLVHPCPFRSSHTFYW